MKDTTSIFGRKPMFDLERTIKEWKKSLRRSPAIQDGDIVELEGYLRDKIEDLRGQGMSEEEAFKKAESEFARSEKLDGDYYRAGTRKWSGRPPWQAPRFMPNLLWSFLKVSLRRIRRHWGSSLINTLSLAIGLACFVMFFMSWTYERSFDRSVKDASRIYRLDLEMAGGNTYANRVCMPWVPLLADNIPEIEDVARFNETGPGTIRSGEKNLTFPGNAYFADSAIFRLLDLPFVRGDSRVSLDGFDSIVLSESTARSLFGDADPLGQTVQVIFSQYFQESRKIDLQVRGVLKNQPAASSFRFDVVVPLHLQGRFWGFEPGRYGGAALTRWEDESDAFVKIRKDVLPADLERKITALTRSHMPSELARFSNQVKTVILSPLTRLHLADKNLAAYLRLFAVIVLAVLLLAVINFINLSTAQSVTRIREVGVRKIAGADRLVLIRQFLGESILLALSAMVIALLAIGVLHPLFESSVRRNVEIAELWNAKFVLELLGLTILVGILAGAYPAFRLSGVPPIRLFGLGRTSRTSRSPLRKCLIFAQFSLLGLLMIATWTVGRQMRLINRTEQRYDRDRTVLIKIDARVGTFNKPGLITYKNILHSNPVVAGVSFMMMPPPYSYQPIQVRSEGGAGSEPMTWSYQLADADFLEIFSIPIVAGRNFYPESSADMKDAVLINETAAKALGPASPLGRRLSTIRYGRPRNFMVVGVFKDFNDRNLHQRIEPLIMANDVWSREGARWIAVKIGGSDLKSAVSSIERAWMSLFPDSVFEYRFLDDWMRGFHLAEDRMGRLGRLFSGIAVVLACLGLFGLVVQGTKQRRKEMGIRKVLGASLGRINWEFLKEFAKPVLFSNLIAWPAAYFWGRKWLQGFAYRVDLPWSIFFLTSVFAIWVALATVGLQVFRASAENPADTLRCE
jgi:putative ABC transport system permease protein